MVDKVIFGVALPAVVGIAILVVGWRLWRRGEPYASGHWSVPLALMAAFSLSFVSKNWPTIISRAEDRGPDAALLAPVSPDESLVLQIVEGTIDAFTPNDKRDRIFLLALVAGVIGVGGGLVHTPRWARWMAGPLLALATGIFILPIERWTYPLGGIWGLMVATMVAWLLLEPLASRREGTGLPMAFMIVAAGVAGMIRLTGSPGVAMVPVCWALSAICAAGMFATWLNPRFSMARGGATALGTILVTMCWLQAWYTYVEIGPIPYVLPLAAFPLLWLGELRVVTRRPSWVRILVRGALGTIPVAASLVWVMMADATG